MSGVVLRLGDCREVLAKCKPDCVVTDPPYGLSKEPNIAEVLTHWLAGDDYKHRGGGFMGKSWDSFVPGPQTWKEIYRVLKPGARFFYCAKASRQDRGLGNNHPTVKPQALMRYLVRLVTPPGGIVLDPFMGSGSTGKAAKAEGFKFFGITDEQPHLEIAQRRISEAA